MGKIPKYASGKKNNKKKGQKSEQKIKRTISSGSLWCDKGDLKWSNEFSDFLIEHKHTEKTGFRITEKLIDKIVEEAYSIKKEPLITIELPKYLLAIKIKIKKI